MPTIVLSIKQKPQRTVNRYRQQEVYQDKRWKTLRSAKFAANPLCENCLTEGRVTQTEEVHHIIPFDITSSQDRIAELAYDWDNLESLCIECHHRRHQQLKVLTTYQGLATY